MRRALLVAMLVGALHPASASAAMTDLQIADAAWPGHPCTGQVQIVMDPGVGLRGNAAEATGAVTGSCVVSFSPAWWAAAPRQHRCQMVVHEVGHLAGHDHVEHGVMAAMPDPYLPCARSLRERIVTTLYVRHPDRGPLATIVICSAWRGKVLPCVVDVNERRFRYQVRVRGNTFSLNRAPRRSS